ncbi:hypothetical protein Pyn_33734 [Prunus yedoensis var. nudiflora]|uniref:Uncharacterized protein n=1 Tax=Prunus yedoensis var. nudiflora TaxID=2094558 RepID=A0A314XLQ2_PRUYE|nr:hypothetical protein Pyn_33734 [Prunus yedoensis var. nudiflora]
MASTASPHRWRCGIDGDRGGKETCGLDKDLMKEIVKIVEQVGGAAVKSNLMQMSPLYMSSKIKPQRCLEKVMTP